jgi:excisionase family DNA binding protein
MVAHALATLDPVDPGVQAEAHRLAALLADDPSRDTAVNRAVRSMLDNIIQGERVVVIRDDEAVTPTQAAEMLGVTRQYVDRLMNDGVLPFLRRPGSTHRRVKVADVLALGNDRERRRAGHVALLDALADAGLLDDA